MYPIQYCRFQGKIYIPTLSFCLQNTNVPCHTKPCAIYVMFKKFMMRIREIIILYARIIYEILRLCLLFAFIYTTHGEIILFRIIHFLPFDLNFQFQTIFEAALYF